MLRAVIFDFNGVLIDDDEMHLQLFQEVLAEIGIELSDEKARKYIASSDIQVFTSEVKIHGLEGKYNAEDLVSRKAEEYAKLLPTLDTFPGAIEFVKEAARQYILAIASGALRWEISEFLQRKGISDKFRGKIASAEDVINDKPDPECFQKALNLINKSRIQSESPIQSEECIVIEDTPEGIQAAHAAGMKCLAITNTHSGEQLASADEVISSLEGYKIEDLEELCS